LNRRTAFVRALYVSAALAAGLALASCETDGNGDMTRAMRPLSPEMVSLLEQKHMPKESPILIRIFKEEAEMEVWKQDDTGHFALLKTYPICRWSGDLGPKIKEGDRQAPEGYYEITPGQMNPRSNYYLSFNLGFPNAYDKANDRTGAFLMVHGDCSSAGCYAMTDEQMGEIYPLGREAFFGGQTAFQVQAYPFRMTPANLARHRNSPYMAFWRMIKEGYDHFEVTRQEPKIDVCDKHYVFDAVAPHGASTPLTFNPKGRCPAYEIQEDIAAAVKEKHDSDEREFANLVKSGVPVVASRAGIDGGMNPVFEAKMHPTLFNQDGRVQAVAAAPGTVPPNVNPPRAPEDAATGTVEVADAPLPRSAPQAKVGTAPPQTAPNGLFGGLFSTASSDSKPAPDPAGNKPSGGPLDGFTKWVGLQKSDPPPEETPVPPPPPQASKPKPKPVQTATRAVPHSPSHSTAHPTQEPPAPAQAKANSTSPQQTAANPPSVPPPATAPWPSPNQGNLIVGAQPMVPSASFDSRWNGAQ
jgi:murein L,D-transpeptidase YafK